MKKHDPFRNVNIFFSVQKNTCLKASPCKRYSRLEICVRTVRSVCVLKEFSVKQISLNGVLRTLECLSLSVLCVEMTVICAGFLLNSASFTANQT